MMVHLAHSAPYVGNAPEDRARRTRARRIRPATSKHQSEHRVLVVGIPPFEQLPQFPLFEPRIEQPGEM